MSTKIYGLSTTSSVASEGINYDAHFLKVKMQGYGSLGDPKRFITSPTEIRQKNYKVAANLLKSWLDEDGDFDDRYDELEIELEKKSFSLSED